jgi:hypothetical protein
MSEKKTAEQVAVESADGEVMTKKQFTVGIYIVGLFLMVAVGDLSGRLVFCFLLAAYLYPEDKC